MLAPLLPPPRTAPDDVLTDLSRGGLALIRVEPTPGRLVTLAGALGGASWRIPTAERTA